MINAAFTPAPEQVAEARALIEAFDEAQAEGRMAFSFQRPDGRCAASDPRPRPYREGEADRREHAVGIASPSGEKTIRYPREYWKRF